MNNENITSSQGDLLNDTPLGNGPVNPTTGLESGKRFKIDVDKLNRADALMRGQLMGEVYTQDVVLPKSVYRILGDNYHPEFDPEYNAFLLSNNQTNAGKFVSALNQAVVGEIFGGTIQGLGYLIDIPMMVDLAEGTEQEFGNAISEFGKRVKTWTEEATPVYTDPNAPKFAPTSWEWWMKNLPSVASTVSLVLPSMAGMKALQGVGKLVGLTDALGDLGKYSKLFTTAFGQAVMSRHMENLMEASGDYENNLTTAKASLYEKYKDQIQADIKALPLITAVDKEIGPKPGDYTEDMYNADLNRLKNKWENIISGEANKLAAVAAANTYNKNWVMLLQDLPEYMLLNRFLKPGVNTIGKDVAENSAKVAKRLDYNMPAFYASKSGKQILNMAGEGLEEGYQFLINKQSSEMIKRIGDPNHKYSLIDALGDTYDSGELWTNMFFGAIGAGFMQASMAGLNAKALANSTKTRLNEINRYSELLNKLKSDVISAQEEGDKISEEAAWKNFEAAVGIKGVQLDTKKHLMSILDALATDDQDVLSNHEISKESRTFFKNNADKINELKKNLDNIETKYKDSFSELKKRGLKDDRTHALAASMAHSNYMLEFLNGKLNETETQLKNMSIPGYNKVNEAGEELSTIGQQIFALRHERALIKRRSEYLKKKIEKPNTAEKEKEQLQKQIDRYDKRLGTIKSLIKEVNQGFSQLTPEQQALDKKLLGTEDGKTPGTIPSSMVLGYTDEATNKHVPGYLDLQKDVNEYKENIDYFKDNLDAIRAMADEEVKTPVTKKPEPKTTTEEDDIDIIPGSMVRWTDQEGKTRIGTVESIEYADKDTKGKDQIPSSENANNVITVRDVDTKEVVNLFGISVVPLTEKEVAEYEKGIAEDDSDDIESPFVKEKNKELTTRPDKPSLIEFLSDSQYEGSKTVARDKAFNKFISNPANQKFLPSAIAEYEIEWENEKFKEDLAKLEKSTQKLLEDVKSKAGTKLDDNAKREISKLLKAPELVGIIPIKVKVTINGKSFKNKLYLFTLEANKKNIYDEPNYTALNRQAFEMRSSIIGHLLNGDRTWTTGLSTNRGKPLNIDKSNSRSARRRNVAEVFGINPKEAELYVLKSSTKSALAGRYQKPLLHKSLLDTDNSIKYDFRSPGSVYIKTNKTVNGEPFAVKLNKSFISEEHAFIIFNAFSTLAKTELQKHKDGTYTFKNRKKGRIGDYSVRLNPQIKKEEEFEKGAVYNISAGEILDLLVVHGENITDPDSSRYKYVNEAKSMDPAFKQALKNKRLFLQRGYDENGNVNAIYLCYGVSPAPYEVHTSTKGIKKQIDYNRINLTGETYDTNPSYFLQWLQANKTYAVHLEHEKMLGLKLNGTFLQGRSFRIGKKGLKVTPSDTLDKKYSYGLESEIIRGMGESYVEFLIKNNFVTTDIEPNEDGLLFDKPMVHLGFTSSNKEDFGIQTGKTPNTKVEILSDKEAESTTPTQKVENNEKKKEHTAKDSDNPIDDIMNDGPKFFRERTTLIKTPYEKQDLEKELSWVRRRLNIGEDEVKVEHRLSNLTSNGRKAWGIYSNSLITLYEAAEVGTVYHEAWHRASLGYFRPEERQAIYRSARLLYNMPKGEFSDRDIEEKLAEEFREFVLSKQKASQPSAIKRMFKEIVDFIKAVYYWFGGNRLSNYDIDNIFNDMYSGRYRYSKVRKENYSDVLYMREIMGQNFDTIATYKDITDVTKFLADQLLRSNNIHNLESVKRLNWLKFVQALEKKITAIENELKKPDLSEQARNIGEKNIRLLKDVLGEKNENGDYTKYASFKHYIKSFLKGVGITYKKVDTEEESIYEDDNYDQDIFEDEKSNKANFKSSVDYVKPLKDNALATIKFMISTLHEADNRSMSTGLTGFADGNKVWGKLLHDIIKYDNVDSMIAEIESIGLTENYYPYLELAHILRNSKESTRTKFQRAFEAHKHEFIYGEFRTRKDGTINMIFDAASHKELSRSAILKWNEFIQYDRDIIKIDQKADGKSISRSKNINSDFFKELQKSYEAKVEDFYDEKTNKDTLDLSEEELQDLFERISSILHRVHIYVTPDVIRRYTYNINTKGELKNNIRTMITNIRSILGEDVLISKKTEKIANIIINPVVRSLGEAYADVNIHEESDMVIGPGGNKFYKYGRLNLITDNLRRIKKDDEWAKRKLSRVNNKRSRILKSFVESEEARNKFDIVTLSAVKSANRADRGKEYLKLNDIEDYLMKSSAILNGKLLPFPIIANRQTYYFMKGVKLIGVADEAGNPLSVIKSYNSDGTVQFTDEVISLFYDYYLDEKERVDKAKEELADFKAKRKRLNEDLSKPGANVDQIKKELKSLKNRLIREYHYFGEDNYEKGNAYNFIHFKGFEKYKTPEDVRVAINEVLNDRLKEDLAKLEDLDIISINEFEGSKIISSNKIDSETIDKNKDLENPAAKTESAVNSNAVLSVISKVLINTQMSIIEAEKMFLGDPALFKRGKNTPDTYEQVYKRWFGTGSTGDRLRYNIPGRSSTYNVAIFNTQKFPSKFQDVLVEQHSKLYEKMLYNRLSEDDKKLESKLTEIKESALELAKLRLKGYGKVDPTDGTAYISPEMYKEILDRMGIWTDREEKAYQLLQSDKEVSEEDLIEASNIVFSPLKTMYIGDHDFNGVDLTIYNKMAMFPLYRQLVKGTHLEEVLDRMELKGKYSNKDLKKIHVYNFDSAIKVGGLNGVNMFENPKTRDKVTDLSDSFVFEQSFDFLKHQQVTDPHSSVKQDFGTAGMKIGMADIALDQPYGEFKTGADLLNAINEARIAVSNHGVHKVNAKFGIFKGKISNKIFIDMLARDAESANKSYDFQQALRVNESGEKYLELDAFNDRTWIYARIKTLVDELTVDLQTPGNQLYQMSDYGMSKSGYKKDLEMTRLSEDGKKIYEMECRVSSRLFKHFFPEGYVVDKEDLTKLLNDKPFLFGYRIPTQGQNSILKLKVVDFLTEQAGDIIQLPLEFTALTGSDFDIDKLFIAMYHMNHKYDSKGRFEGLQKVEFKDDSNSTVEERYRYKVVELFKLYKNHASVFGDIMVNENGEKVPIVSKYFKDYVSGKYKNITDEEISKLEDEESEYVSELKRLDEKRDLVQKTLDADKHGEDHPYRKSLQMELTGINNAVDDLKSRMFVPSNLLLPLIKAEKNANEDIEEDYNKLINALIKADLLPTIEEFKSLPMSEQNTSEASKNRVLDLLFTVLTDVKHFINTTTPLGTLTDKLESKSSFYEKCYSKHDLTEVPALFTTTPSFQSSMKAKFSAATFGISSYALNNNHHALTQMAEVIMKSNINLGWNEKGEIPLNQIIGMDNMYITWWISALIDIHVDGVNKPIATPLNINEYTHDVVNFLIRAGVGEDTFDFIAQPILMEYALNSGKLPPKKGRRYNTITSIKGDNAITYTKESFEDTMLQKGLKTEHETLPTIPLRKLLNEKQLKADALAYKDVTKRDKNWYIRQLSILEHFKQIQKDADILRNFVLASRVDTKKYGSNPVEIRYFITSIKDIIDSGKFTNIDKILTYDKDYKYKKGDTFLPTLIKNSMFKIFDILSKDSIYATEGFNKILESLVQSSYNGDKNNLKKLRFLSEELMTYFISKFFSDPNNGLGLEYDDLRRTVMEVPSNKWFEFIVKLKTGNHKLSPLVKGNLFLNSILVDNSDNILRDLEGDPLPHTYIKPLVKSLDDVLTNDEAKNSFNELINSEHKELRDLAKFLYVYSFYTSAFRTKMFSYSKWLPVDLNREFVYKDKPVSLNRHIKELLKKLNSPEGYMEFMQEAKREIFTNSWYEPNLIYTINEDAFNVVTFALKAPNDTREKFGIKLEVDSTTAKKLYIGDNSDSKHLFEPYVLITDSSGVERLYEFVGYGAINHESSIDYELYYVVTPKKGFYNKGIMMHEQGVPFRGNKRMSVLLYNNPTSEPYSTDELVTKLRERLLASKNDKEAINRFVEVKFSEQIPVKKARLTTGFYTVDSAAELRDLEVGEKLEQDKRNLDRVESKKAFGDEAQAIIENSNIKASLDNATTYNAPIYVDVAGVHSKDGNDIILGSGAYSNFLNKKYLTYVPDSKIREYLVKYFDAKDIKEMKGPVSELFSILTVLNSFAPTSEHIVIQSDIRQLNIGELDTSELDIRNWSFKDVVSNGLLDKIKDRINQIESNGGSVRNVKVDPDERRNSYKLAKGEYGNITNTRNDFRDDKGVKWGRPKNITDTNTSPSDVKDANETTENCK